MRAMTFSGRVLSVALACCLTVAVSASAQEKKKTLTSTKFDPQAQQIEMFEAINQNLIEVKVVPKDSLGGNVFINNKHNAPLTVKAPPGFVGVQVTSQFGGQGGGFGGQGGQLGGGGQFGGGGIGGGGGQSIGGGLGGGGLGGGGFGGQQGGIGGQQGGFFSIPAERTLRLPYTSVCLEHGKNEPSRRMEYTIIPIEQYTKDPVLQQLICLVGTGQLDKGSSQAAAWHIANGMSFQQLGMKVYQEMGKQDAPYFNVLQLQGAQNIIVAARQRAAEEAERKAQNPEQEQIPATQPVINPRAK